MKTRIPNIWAVLALALFLSLSPPLTIHAEAGPLQFCGRVWGYLVGAVDRAKVCFGICNEGRTAPEYVTDFGQPLIHALHKLGPNDWVYDMGSGAAFFGRQLFRGEPMEPVTFRVTDGYQSVGRDMAIPLYRYFQLPEKDQQALSEFAARPPEEKPHFVGVARRVPKGVETDDRFQLVAGDWDRVSDPMHEELANKGVASVVIDEFGILAYTTDPESYLNFVFDRLKVGGSYFVNHSEMHFWVSYKGKKVSFEKFMEMIPNVEVRRLAPVGEDRESGKIREIMGGLQIIKKGPVKIPWMRLGPGVPLHQGVSFRLILAKDRAEESE